MGYFRGSEIIFVMGLVRVLHVAIDDHYSFCIWCIYNVHIIWNYRRDVKNKLEMLMARRSLLCL